MLRFLKTRKYATEASSALKVSFTLPHQTIINNKQLTQVNLTTTDGDVGIYTILFTKGILANHVPTILQLKPGKITFLSSDKESESWFASGGFALIHPDSTLKINAIEAFSLDDIDFEVLLNL